MTVGIRLTNSHVLVRCDEPAERTAGGVELPDAYRRLPDLGIRAGDVVRFRAGDGEKVNVGGEELRLLQMGQIIGVEG
jgi:co-chaperonin GroES (HSP10)